MTDPYLLLGVPADADDASHPRRLPGGLARLPA